MFYVEAAGEHARHLGIGEEDLMQKGCTWILSRLSSVIRDRVDVRLPLDIETSILRLSGLTSLRAIRASQEGRLLSTTLSQWAVMGMESRRPVPIAEVVGEKRIDCLAEGEWDLPTLPRRVIPDDAALRAEGEHEVLYSDLDFNRHFNSSAWISTALDALPLDQLSRQPRRLDLHFIREAVCGERLRVLHAATADGATHFVRLSHSDDSPGFELSITF